MSIAALTMGLGAPGGKDPNRIIGPDYIATISNGGTRVYTYDVDTETLSEVTSTYLSSGTPASAGGYEGIHVTPNGEKMTATGWTSPLRCATWDLTSSGIWTRYDQTSLPIGSGGNALGGTPALNSRGSYVTVSTQTSTYRSTATGNSWTNIGYSGYVRLGAGHNKLYLANSNTSLRVYDYTAAPSFRETVNCGSSGRMSCSEREYLPNSYTDSPKNEIIAVSGATSALVIYKTASDSYAVLRQGSVSDSLPTTYGAGVTRDGTRAVFCDGTKAYIYDIDPDAETASLKTSFDIAYGVGFSGDCDIFPSGNAIAVMDGSTMAIYDINGNLLDTISAGTYGLTCIYDGVNATA